MAIPQNYGLGVLWAVAVLSALPSHAQVFTYRHGAGNFQAVVSDDRLIVKERYQGISSVYGDSSCPLGLARSSASRRRLQALHHVLEGVVPLHAIPEWCRGAQ